jgi:hypothetical protein
MTTTHVVRIIQTIHIPHTETVVRSWYDVITRTIERTLDTDQRVIAEVVEEKEVDTKVDYETEIIESDEDLLEEEIVEEAYDEEE